MILSDRQYNVAQEQVVKLRSALDGLSIGISDDWLATASKNALNSQIDDITNEMVEYDLLKSNEIAVSESFSLSELPIALIKARISRGISQTDLAHRLGMKPQQVQRYEATEYSGANLSRLIEVATALDVKVRESFYSAEGDSRGAIFSWGSIEDISWSHFPINEMIKRRWFAPKSGVSRVDACRDYFTSSAGPEFATAFHRKKIRGDSIPNEFALLAWQARVLSVARELSSRHSIGEFDLNDTWIGELRSISALPDGPSRATRFLADHGIALVIERHLPGTYLDGAAMMSRDGIPVVALTLRYDRLDHFWFVLFHELGHVFLHLFRGYRFDFFDNDETASKDNIEQDADDFALNELLPLKDWNTCLSRFALTEEAVIADARRLGVGPWIIAGRIRKDNNDYRILNGCIGAGLVRSQFTESGDEV